MNGLLVRTITLEVGYVTERGGLAVGGRQQFLPVPLRTNATASQKPLVDAAACSEMLRNSQRQLTNSNCVGISQAVLRFPNWTRMRGACEHLQRPDDWVAGSSGSRNEPLWNGRCWRREAVISRDDVVLKARQSLPIYPMRRETSE